MTAELSQWVVEQLDKNTSLTDDARYLVLAALGGDQEITDVLGGHVPVEETENNSAPPPEPTGAFLKSIRVQGFRGIGEEVHLALQPGPGLTVIAGRNGSGKSSIAEAFEVALTGTTYRWHQKAAQWQERWRNIHQPVPAGIRVQLAEEGARPTTIGIEWPEGAELKAFTSWVQRDKQKREPGTDSLGWAGPVETFRPMLSYDELGGMFDAGPSKLYDALATVLGLEQITDAIKRLGDRHKAMAQPEKQLATDKKSLVEALSDLDDERAQVAASLLRKTTIDAGRVRALATGTGSDRSSVAAQLRTLASLAVPAKEQVESAVETLRAAVAQAAKVAEGTSDVGELRKSLLADALAFHEHAGDSTCPVCETGILDLQWAERVREVLASTERETARLQEARRALQQGRRTAHDLVRSAPSVLFAEAPDPALTDLVAQTAHLWETWATVPDDDLDLCDHLLERHARLEGSVEKLHRQATLTLQNRDDAWSAVASQLARWVDDHDRWQETKPVADNVKAAHTWLKANDTRLKNERIAPIAEHAREIWSLLRQESNVEISDLRLEGTNTRRRAVITAEVDGTEAGALAVMSQGELHALALALFLPRATMPTSPFRFVVLDDPVQAMDPAKIDGLVQVLAKLAKERQVIVLSHDDRLPRAVRRSAFDNARILEVTRGEGSRVHISNASEPALRYLRDADAVTKDLGLPEETLRRTLPGLLRLAAESAARDRFFNRELSDGAVPEHVEKRWQGARKTAERMALALYGDGRPLDGWLDKAAYRRRALGICSSALHQGLRGSPEEACSDVRRLVEDIRVGMR